MNGSETGPTPKEKAAGASRKRLRRGLRGWQKLLLMLSAVLIGLFGTGFWLIRHTVGRMHRVNESTQSFLSQDEYIRLMRELYGSDWQTVTAGPTEGTPEKTGSSAGTQASAASSPSSVPPLPSKGTPEKTSAETEDETKAQPESPGETETSAAYPMGSDWTAARPLEDEGFINILLVGHDREASTGFSFSDTMILCSINPDTHRAALISFLRDLHLNFGDYGYNNLNHAYAIGGFSMLDTVLRDNFGLHIDGYAGVGIEDMEKIVEYLGGADLYLTKEEAEWLPAADQLCPSAGWNHLNGKQAVAYARLRETDNDFHRTERQRRLLSALFENVKHAGVSNLMRMLNDILPFVDTTMSGGEILGYAAQVLPYFTSTSVASYRIPAEGSYYDDFEHGQYVIRANQYLNISYLKSILPY